MTKIMKRTSRHSRGKVCTRSKPNGKTQKTSDDTGRTSTGICRLCHGKFSTRHLRKAFAQLQEESHGVCSAFCRDFQQLLGIPMHQDPSLSQFICNTCHAQFYKCHSILLDFRSRVNLTPFSRDSVGTEHSSSREDMALFRSEHGCLHSLVSWTHTHAEGCHSIPDLQKVLEGQYWGALKVVWGCVDGHSYVMDTSTVPLRPSSSEESSREHHEDKSVTHQNHSKTDADSCEEETSPAADLLLLDQHADADSDQSDRLRSVLRGEAGPGRRKSSSSEDSLDLLPVPSPSKKSEVTTHQAKCRKKPGPKPGWKNKSEREELPTIYKCPHQGCTAVYRGADGLKKHIKEHHEEVRERPCPHPGCNKVFMIDRYLQRHVKLIHTEVRNYICDQCGQTFKQRKHLSVHQMRHSGAKPLQCEVCGFQCRQRASLKYHMTKHKAEAELEFACVTCAKRFEKAHNLNVHMSMVHPLMQGVAAQAPPHSINYMLEGLQAKLTEPS